MRSLTLLLAAFLLIGFYATELSADTTLAQRAPIRQRGAGDNFPPPETIVVGGVEREYWLHRPARGGGGKMPLVIALHGGEGHPLRLARQTGFNDVADRNGFIVVYPSAGGRQWNDGRSTTAGGDDVAFIRELIDHLIRTEGVDPARVYATGTSNGGHMTLRLACELSDRIAAFAAIAGSFPKDYMRRCSPKHPVSVMLIHGSEDRFVRWQGGEIPKGRRRGAGGAVEPVPETVKFLAERDGCRADPEVEKLPDRDPDDGTSVEVTRYADCRGDSEVVLVRIIGGGHAWPGSRAHRSNRLARRASRELDGAAYVWNFFRDRSLAEGGAAVGK
ncbi:MAG TPA: PHB depolymerase family esterase [Woeseiaceae bacterium]